MLKEKLLEKGFEDTIILENPSYEKAILGVSVEGRLIYSYNEMVECLIEEGMTEEDAIEFIDYNTIRALPYMGENKPIILYDLD